MRKIIFAFLILPLFCCFPKTRQYIGELNRERNKAGIDTIIINHVELTGIFTIADVHCDDFDRIFADDIERDTITDKDEIILLKSYLDCLRPLDSSSRKSIDTRAKLLLLSSLGVKECCIDSGLTYSNEVFYVTSKELSDYIENLPK